MKEDPEADVMKEDPGADARKEDPEADARKEDPGADAMKEDPEVDLEIGRREEKNPILGERKDPGIPGKGRREGPVADSETRGIEVSEANTCTEGREDPQKGRREDSEEELEAFPG